MPTDSAGKTYQVKTRIVAKVDSATSFDTRLIRMRSITCWESLSRPRANFSALSGCLLQTLLRTL